MSFMIFSYIFNYGKAILEVAATILVILACIKYLRNN